MRPLAAPSNKRHVYTDTINSSEAAFIRSTYPYKRQRPITLSHVKKLLRKMEAGRFVRGQIALAVTPDGKFHQIDGNHTLEALREYSPAQSGFPFNVEIFVCLNYEEVHELYRIFADQRNRNLADIMGTKDEFAGFTYGILAETGAAVRIICNGFNNRLCADNEDVAALSGAYPDEARLYYQIIADAEPNLRAVMRRAAIMSTGLYTLKHAPAEAEVFWRKVALHDGLPANDPASHLYAHLLSISKVNLPHDESLKLKNHVAAAWNLHYVGKKVTYNSGKQLKPLLNFSLAGTPLSKQHEGNEAAEGEAQPPPAMGGS